MILRSIICTVERETLFIHSVYTGHNHDLAMLITNNKHFKIKVWLSHFVVTEQYILNCEINITIFEIAGFNNALSNLLQINSCLLVTLKLKYTVSAIKLKLILSIRQERWWGKDTVEDGYFFKTWGVWGHIVAVSLMILNLSTLYRVFCKFMSNILRQCWWV